MTYHLGDKIILKGEHWVSKFARIIAIQTKNGYPQYSLRFKDGIFFAWINDSEIAGLQFEEDEKVEFT